MAKRISSSSINWALIAEKAVGDDKAKFLSFKSKADKFLRLATSQPAELPKIDWSVYKSKVSKPGFVDSFQKGYESMSIPFPSDQGLLAKRDSDEAESMKKAAKIDEDNLKKLENLKMEIIKLEKQKKYSEMSLEEFMIHKPEYRLDPDNPRMFPQFVDTAPEYDERKPLPPVAEH